MSLKRGKGGVLGTQGGGFYSGGLRPCRSMADAWAW